MGAEFLVQIEPVGQTNHDLGKGQILFEALVGNVEQGLAASRAKEFEVSRLQRGHGAVHECGVIGDAVDARPR